MQRGWMDSPVFAPEPFTEREAFQWMVESAAWKDCRVRCGKYILNVQRGQFAVSVRFIAEKLDWHRAKVERFLTKLKTETLIETDARQGLTVITICNYGDSQSFHSGDFSQTETLTEEPPRQYRDSTETNKNTLNTILTPDNTKKETPLPPKGGELPFEDSVPVVETPVKKKPKKEKPQEAPLVIPDFIPEAVLNDFFADRADRKEPMTARAKKLLINEIIKLYHKGHDPTKLINKAIRHGWKSVYEANDTLTDGVKNEPFQQSNARNYPQSKPSFQSAWDEQREKNLAFIADLKRKAAAEERAAKMGNESGSEFE